MYVLRQGKRNEPKITPKMLVDRELGAHRAVAERMEWPNEAAMTAVVAFAVVWNSPVTQSNTPETLKNIPVFWRNDRRSSSGGKRP
jgi:hypothetical protein